MSKFNLCIACCLLMIMAVFGIRNCPWSQQTVETTDSCPKDKSEMEERSKRKNCDGLAQIQNCTEPQNFKYHCVINELGNSIVEVCAEAYYIHGYCPEYNTYGAVVQAHFNLKCSEVQPPCPDRYLSTESYLYSSCMETVKKQTRNAPIIYEGLDGHNESGNNTSITVIAVVVPVVAVLIIFFIVVILYLRSALNRYFSLVVDSRPETNA